MKAIRVREFGGPEKLVLETVQDPLPGPGEVVVRIHAVGINPVEAYIRTGTYAMKPPLPYTPGTDGAGVVVSTGDKVSSVKPGDRVYLAGSLSGTYAEQTLCKESQVHLLPERINFPQGAALGIPYATAYRALFQKAKAAPGEWVLVHGASGGVGLAAVQLAAAHGLSVIGTAGTDDGRKLARQNGARHALDHHSPDLAEQVKSLTGGLGVNVILEMLANKNLAVDLSILRQRGRVVIIGNRGTIEINPRDIMGRDATLLGMVLFNATEQELAEIHAGLGAALASGVAKPVIGKEFHLADAAQAHEAVMQPGSRGKIVLLL